MLDFAAATDEAPPRIAVIAEIGVNHDGDADRAVELVQAAAEAGADAVKVQVFTPARLMSEQAGLAEYQKVQQIPDASVAPRKEPASASALEEGEGRRLLEGLVLPLAALQRVRAAAREAESVSSRRSSAPAISNNSRR